MKNLRRVITTTPFVIESRLFHRWAGKTPVRILVFWFGLVAWVLNPVLAAESPPDFLWGKPLGTIGENFGESVTVDPDGNIYISGSFTNVLTLGPLTLASNGEHDVFVAKYDPSGNVLWAKSGGGYREDFGHAVAERMSDGFKYSVMTTLKYDPNGNELWRTNATAYSGEYLIIDRAGNALVVGFVGAGCGVRPCSAAVLTKYDPDGQRIGSASDGGGSSITALGFDIDGNLYTAGFVAFPVSMAVNFVGAVIVKYREAPTDLPSVSITAPLNGAACDQPVDLRMQVTATAGQGKVMSVAFFDSTNRIGAATLEPFTTSYFKFIWTNAPAGNHTVFAVATDDQGRSNRSSGVLVAIRTNIPPSVTLTSPTNASPFAAPATISVTAVASDQDGTVAKVEFFEGPTLVGTATASPYSIVLPQVPAGSYSFRAVAADRLGAKGQSSSIEVTVTGPPAAQTAFTGKPLPIPGRIEAEQFDRGGEGVAFHDFSSGGPGNGYRDDASVEIEPCTDTGGGHNVARFRPGEWLEYTIDVAHAGLYVLELRLSSPNGGGSLHLEINRQDQSGPMRVPFTGSGQNWITTRRFFSLDRGLQGLRLAMDSPERESQYDGSINYLDIFSQGAVGNFYLPAAPVGGRLKLRFRPDQFASREPSKLNEITTPSITQCNPAA